MNDRMRSAVLVVTSPPCLSLGTSRHSRTAFCPKVLSAIPERTRNASISVRRCGVDIGRAIIDYFRSDKPLLSHPYTPINFASTPSGMQTSWRERLKRLIDETPGLTMKGISVKAGLHPSTVQSIVSKGTSPSIDNFLAICKAAGVRPAALLGDEDLSLSVPVVGQAAGEAWTPVDDATHPPIGFELGGHDTIAVRVAGDAMAPAYRDGDTPICHRQFGPHADNLIGCDCVVRTTKGAHYVKILKRGSRPGRFNLKSYNPVVDDIEDVALAWVAPIAWIRRGQ